MLQAICNALAKMSSVSPCRIPSIKSLSIPRYKIPKATSRLSSQSFFESFIECYKGCYKLLLHVLHSIEQCVFILCLSYIGTERGQRFAILGFGEQLLLKAGRVAPHFLTRWNSGTRLLRMDQVP
jgi:hypothetical protein